MKEKESYAQKHYTVSEMSAEVLRMETGLPTKEVFNIVVLYALRFKDCIVYYTFWVRCSRLLIFYFKEKFFVLHASACPLQVVYFQSVLKTLCKK